MVLRLIIGFSFSYFVIYTLPQKAMPVGRVNTARTLLIRVFTEQGCSTVSSLNLCRAFSRFWMLAQVSGSTEAPAVTNAMIVELPLSPLVCLLDISTSLLYLNHIVSCRLSPVFPSTKLFITLSLLIRYTDDEQHVQGHYWKIVILHRKRKQLLLCMQI